METISPSVFRSFVDTRTAGRFAYAPAAVPFWRSTFFRIFLTPVFTRFFAIRFCFSGVKDVI